MKNGFGAVLLAAALSATCAFSVFAETEGFEIRENAVNIQEQSRNLRACTIDGKDYFLLRDIACYSGMFFVDYDIADNIVIIHAAEPFEEQDYVSNIKTTAQDCRISPQRMYLAENGQEISLEAYNIDGYNYIPLEGIKDFISEAYVYKQNNEMVLSRNVQIYTVAPGDTISAISQHYYGTPAGYVDILEANGLSDPSVLRVGMELIIP